MTKPAIDDLVALFGLEPLADEGGLFRRTWFHRAADGALIGSCIVYLITPESFSALHRLAHDEIFHFYLGDPCEMVTVSSGGSFGEFTLGQDVLAGQRVQHVVPGGSCQGTRLCPGGAWALLGTTMAPGFIDDELEMATPNSISSFAPEVQEKVRDFLSPGA